MVKNELKFSKSKITPTLQLRYDEKTVVAEFALNLKQKLAIQDALIEYQNKYAIHMENITKSYFNKAIMALDNVSFDVFHNEIHALVGENGAGKSTLMSILFGINKPDEGRI